MDTNVLVDVLEDDPSWADWSEHQLRIQSRVHELLINPVIFSELSLLFESVTAVDRAIDGLGLTFQEIPKPALFLASRAFVKYRRAGGKKNNVLADFFIGAHAAVLNCGILTRDATRYRNHFPRVTLVVPTSASRSPKQRLPRSLRALSTDHAPEGIRVNAVCPGTIATPPVQRAMADAQARDAYSRAHALRRLGRPEEIANAAVWLASDEASFVTGEALVVDGGWMAQSPVGRLPDIRPANRRDPS